MGLIGIILASVVNIFLASSALHFVISVVGVLVFAGLTAYDTQQIKNMYYAADSGAVATKKSIMGALRLYLDLLNLFLRSEARRVGKLCGMSGRLRGSPDHYTTKINLTQNTNAKQ